MHRLITIVALVISTHLLHAEQIDFSPNDVLHTRFCSDLDISPNGRYVAYTVDREREPRDPVGPSYSELFVAKTNSSWVRSFVAGHVDVSSPKFSPDGKSIAFLLQRGKNEKTQVWRVFLDGGEAVQITNSSSDVQFFAWHPSGETVAYLATAGESEQEKLLKQKGYNFVFYEENLKHKNIYLQKIPKDDQSTPAVQLTNDITVWDFVFSPDGRYLAASASPQNLIDHYYMFRDIIMLDTQTQKQRTLVDVPGKLGSYAFNPDGEMLAYTAAIDRKDHAVSQVYVIPCKGGQVSNRTEPDFKGHVEWVGWVDAKTIVYKSAEGCRSTYSTVATQGGKRKILLDSKQIGLVFGKPSLSDNFPVMAFIAENAHMPPEAFYWNGKAQPKRLHNLNSWLEKRKLGSQQPIIYKARDGSEIEGLLVKPTKYRAGRKYPTVVFVHGGPEDHQSDGWLTSYSTPFQVLASKGYVVFAPNYRASTGYGVRHALTGYEDPAGVEFDDIADGIDFLVKSGYSDPKRIGLAGGSYGGYAAAWFASYYTRYVKAVCMFVGISNIISKRGTTDIPYEELYVHSGKPLEKMWELNLKRSPVYWAHQSKTAVLIVGGSDDTRVHPSQSIEFYRRLKMNRHPAVRLVQYPGEQHGNRKLPARKDLLYRQIQWFDWYLFNDKPLDGPMPPLDISDLYDLDSLKSS